MGINASLSELLIWIGLIIGSVGWIFFRNPGVPFWKFSPIWRIKEDLTLIGMFITMLGWGIILIGFLAYLIPSPREEQIGFLIVTIGWASIFGYPILQYTAFHRFSGLWRVFAFLPLLVIGLVVCLSIFWLSKGSNLWPVLLLFTAPFACIYLAILFAARKLLGINGIPRDI
jgi:MFS superfamily sulfate permease-like transporter